MDYKTYFGSFREEVNTYLTKYFQNEKNNSTLITPLGTTIWQKIESFIKDGKRVRAGLVRLGYETCGGKNFKKILPVAAAIEVTHGSILIHDDIIDQDEIRHNQPTVHKQFKLIHIKKHKKGNSEHYGKSMALISGIVGYFGAIKIITDTKFPDKTKVKVLDILSSKMIETGFGEALDVDLAASETVTAKEVNKINELKTSQYTFVGPLTIGGILANANENKLQKFKSFGLPLGAAFQIQDDILGLFGDSKKTGKSAASDIKEGKNTLLYTQALKKLPPTKRKTIKNLWGNRNISDNDAQEARELIKQSGSLVYCQKKAVDHISEAKLQISNITKNKKLQEVYLSLADYIIQREK